MVYGRRPLQPKAVFPLQVTLNKPLFLNHFVRGLPQSGPLFQTFGPVQVLWAEEFLCFSAGRIRALAKLEGSA